MTLTIPNIGLWPWSVWNMHSENLHCPMVDLPAAKMPTRMVWKDGITAGQRSEALEVLGSECEPLLDTLEITETGTFEEERLVRASTTHRSASDLKPNRRSSKCLKNSELSVTNALHRP